MPRDNFLYKPKKLAIKICGLKEEISLESALDAGADYVGFVFYPPSPRALNVKKAATLSALADHTASRIGLFVNPALDDIARILDAVALDVLQLHGTETIDHIAAIKNRFSLPVIKAFGATDLLTLKTIEKFSSYSDGFLFDAPPKKMTTHILPGGTGQSFDWQLVKNFPHHPPWMLAGGLNKENVKDALQKSSARAIDVSSSLETYPGKKSPQKIADFIMTAHRAWREIHSL